MRFILTGVLAADIIALFVRLGGSAGRAHLAFLIQS